MTAMTPTETANLGILDPDYLRGMGESPSSVEFLTSRRPSLLETFGEIFRPELPTPPQEKL